MERQLRLIGELKTHRIIVKDEEVDLHCDFCVKRCPTAAWDMQQYWYNVTKAPGCGMAEVVT